MVRRRGQLGQRGRGLRRRVWRIWRRPIGRRWWRGELVGRAGTRSYKSQVENQEIRNENHKTCGRACGADRRSSRSIVWVLVQPVCRRRGGGQGAVGTGGKSTAAPERPHPQPG